MTPALVLILWPASLFFTAVLSFRFGAYWKSAGSQGRHRAGITSSCGDFEDEGLVEGRSSSVHMPMKPIRWWSDEDDTDVLPRIDDEIP
ncbi:hypothetical protein AWN90_20735 [Nocardia terpenica]|uniref:Uncharacterized protein n=1 Tax=Nocardia terpenica TaxID=455432 RepID=A0A161WR05_9NOCA|nr:hypothetical protein AWN90_20735 [Nocardia terpenica]